MLRDNENEFIQKYTKNISIFLEKLTSDEELINYLSSMNFLNKYIDDETLEKVFENPQFYVSIISFLNSKKIDIPKTFLNLFSAKKSEIPNFNLKQAQIFLNGFLYTNITEFKSTELKVKEYSTLAKQLGLIQNKKLVLDDNTKIQKQIANSLGKIDSIIQIIQLEKSCLGDGLRMVILADYIKADDTDNSHLGVVSIGRSIKNKYKDLPIGVLCGSLILLPQHYQENVNKLLSQNNIDLDSVDIIPFKEDSSFIRIIPKNTVKQCIVSLITELFNDSYIKVLVGTQALLGEGWDAPCINSLVLSSTVSSYMLSNQMRGRAIRIDKNNPEKISNIWHLASIKLPQIKDITKNKIFTSVITSYDIDDMNSGLFDLQQLEKRFEGFEAPSYFSKHEIVNGIERVFSNNNYSIAKLIGEKHFLNLNRSTLNLAKNREQIKKWWDESLYIGYNNGYINNRLSTSVNTPKLTSKKLCYRGYHEILKSLLAIIISYIFSNIFIQYTQTIFIILISITLLAMLYILINFLRTGTIEGIMKQITIVHLETLAYMGYIKTSLKNVGISIEKQEANIIITCNNLSAEENNLLINSMKEFLDPIENPRYLFVKHDKFAKFINQTDYFAVPSIFSSNKKNVEVFEKLWQKYIGKCKTIYTRNIKGREILLKARKFAFSSLKRDKTKKLSKWQ